MSVAASIDLDHLGKYTAGDLALRDEILSIFKEQIETVLELFAKAESDDEWHDAAHSMKGAARGVGAWALGDVCEEAEKLVGSVKAKSEKRAAIIIAVRQKVCEAIDDIDDLYS